jgi:hypothetical protein
VISATFDVTAPDPWNFTATPTVVELKLNLEVNVYRSDRTLGGAVAGFFIVLAMIYAVMVLDRASRVVQVVATDQGVPLDRGLRR